MLWLMFVLWMIMAIVCLILEDTEGFWASLIIANIWFALSGLIYFLKKLDSFTP